MFQTGTSPNFLIAKITTLHQALYLGGSGNKEFQSGIANHSDELQNQNSTVSAIWGILLFQGGQHNEDVWSFFQARLSSRS